MGEPSTAPSATLIDVRGPRLARWAPSIVGWGLFALAIGIAAFVPSELSGGLFALAVAVIAGGRHLPRPPARREVRLELADGAIALRGAGLFGGTIRASDVTGATAARNGAGFLLALQVKGRPEPIGLEVADFETLHRVRRALGIGPRGRGQLIFTARPSTAHLVEAFVRLMLAVLAPLAYVGVIADSTLVTLFAGYFALLLVPVSILAMLVRMGASTSTLRLDERVVHVDASYRHPQLPYAAILEVVSTSTGFNVRLEGTEGTYVVPIDASTMAFVPDGMGLEHKELVRRVVDDAAARARGVAAPLDGSADVAALLERRAGEPAAAWLARIDALASTRHSAYRGIALADDVLLTALENVDLSSEVRAGAARMLRGGTEVVRVRVAPIVAAEHDAKLKVRIEAALEGRDEELVDALDEEWAQGRQRSST